MLFLGYFPKFVMGPLERADKLIPQFKQSHVFDYDEAVAGMRIFLVGLFKKIAIADSLAIIVNNVYDKCTELPGPALALGVVLYSFQIYGDFSGYTDMAIGISRILGIRLTENFRCPYLSASVTEFWRRWHISLSTWFRDYVYIPLGGNKVRLLRYLFNTLITMTLSGLWHGSDLTFVFWGFLNGLFLCAEKLFRRGTEAHRKNRGWRRLWKTGLTFILITITWVFFRADSFADAICVLGGCFHRWALPVGEIRNCLEFLGFAGFHRIIILLALVILVVLDLVHDRCPVEQSLQKLSTLPRWLIYVGLTLFILVCQIYNAESQQFIYFQF